MTDKSTTHTIRVITFGVPDRNNDVIMRTAINGNDLVSLVEKGRILSYDLTDSYLDIGLDALDLTANVITINVLMPKQDKDFLAVSHSVMPLYYPT